MVSETCAYNEPRADTNIGTSNLLQSTRVSHSRRNDESESYTTAAEPGPPTVVDTDEEGNQDYETPHSPPQSPSPSPSFRSAQTLFQASKHVSLHITRK
jgi:hypothetical protein